ncbi:hypothetical protein BHE74_00037509 [Ensete ventricosum]|nr:hypothetical protein BHE74_00037509 [Ensete ventricosum]
MRVAIFPLTKGNCSKNTGVLKQVVERGEEVTTGLEGPKSKASVIKEVDSKECHMLVVKGAEKVENAKVNSKYQDKVEGQRPENFINRCQWTSHQDSRKWETSSRCRSARPRNEVCSTWCCTFSTQRSRRQR